MLGILNTQAIAPYQFALSNPRHVRLSRLKHSQLLLLLTLCSSLLSLPLAANEPTTDIALSAQATRAVSTKELTADSASPAAVLSALHQAAATADWDRYFDLFTADASFLGTDKSEHWQMPAFEQYARATKGWTYQEISRSITEHGDVAAFDEELNHEKYGISRGTGTLVRTADGWKILQYHLSFPIPNGLALRITEQIKVFRKQAELKRQRTQQ